MTDINKALAFAKDCLKWKDAQWETNSRGIEIHDGTSSRGFYLTAEDIQRVLDTFLAKRYYIQINRGTTSLFRWSVIVGLQDLSAPGAHHTQARADSDDMFDAIFDACVTAAKIDK